MRRLPSALDELRREYLAIARANKREAVYGCTLCGEEKPASAFYAVSRTARSAKGVRESCKECFRAAMRAYRLRVKTQRLAVSA
jgi:hypothetical protein